MTGVTVAGMLLMDALTAGVFVALRARHDPQMAGRFAVFYALAAALDFIFLVAIVV